MLTQAIILIGNEVQFDINAVKGFRFIMSVECKEFSLGFSSFCKIGLGGWTFL